MLTPEGLPADDLDPIMLLNIWGLTLKQKAGDNPEKSFIFAGMGKPTFPLSLFTVELELKYWQAWEHLLKQAKTAPQMITESLAIDYGDGRGDIEPRSVMAHAMTNWYKTPIAADNILFTVGGAGAIRVIFETFNRMFKDTPRYRVITPFPYYPLYADNQHQLHPVDVMSEPGYQLTAKALEKSIEAAIELARKDNSPPRVLLLCNPNNPLGTVISEEEWKKIVTVLKKYSDLKLVIDEAYAEMYWGEKSIPSILKIAPELQKRVTILRSATKALSAAGERMAMLMAFDSELMSLYRVRNISTIGHAPRSAQLVYAYTMQQFGEHDKKELKDHYLPKLNYVFERLHNMGAAMPDADYKAEGSFYALGDFSDMFGEDIPKEAESALGKGGTIQTDEELIYSLLFKESLMVAAGSYFGMSSNKGFIRITCSGTGQELCDMMNRLEHCLLHARQKKAAQLINAIHSELKWVNDSDTQKSLTNELNKVLQNEGSCLELKAQNRTLTTLLNSIKTITAPEHKVTEALLEKTFFKTEKPKLKPELRDLQQEWYSFVNETFSDDPLKTQFMNLSEEEKNSYKPWLLHLSRLSDSAGSSDQYQTEDNVSGTTIICGILAFVVPILPLIAPFSFIMTSIAVSLAIAAVFLTYQVAVLVDTYHSVWNPDLGF